MAFDPGLQIGDEVSNDRLQKIFKCGNMGGMRKSTKTGTLVIISDKTKPFYHDNWKDGVLLYTGMGKYGDQVLRGNQNQTLYNSNTNGIGVFLFEVMKKSVYTFRGQVKLVGTPYQTDQPDEEGRVRRVWIFPVAPVDSPAALKNPKPAAEAKGLRTSAPAATPAALKNSGQAIEEEDLNNPDPATVAKLPIKELVIRSQMISGPQEPKLAQTTVYHRDEYLKETVKRIADGKCQLCGEDAPFIDNNGEPYLEEHHVKRLADGGSDTIDNVVAICPNCHRKIHVLNDETDTIILEGIAEHNAEALNRLMAYEQKMTLNRPKSK